LGARILACPTICFRASTAGDVLLQVLPIRLKHLLELGLFLGVFGNNGGQDQAQLLRLVQVGFPQQLQHFLYAQEGSGIDRQTFHPEAFDQGSKRQVVHRGRLHFFNGGKVLAGFHQH
jgi:hypothetical protein